MQLVSRQVDNPFAKRVHDMEMSMVNDFIDQEVLSSDGSITGLVYEHKRVLVRVSTYVATRYCLSLM